MNNKYISLLIGFVLSVLASITFTIICILFRIFIYNRVNTNELIIISIFSFLAFVPSLTYFWYDSFIKNKRGLENGI